MPHGDKTAIGLTPMYQHLPEVPGSHERHAWDVWGRNDNMGSMNRIGPEQVLAAAGMVRTGKVVPLSLSLDEPQVGMFPSRGRYVHNEIKTRTGRDDRLDELYLQYSSHWDGLRHVATKQGLFWGGRSARQLDDGDGLGICHWSRTGPIGRGILVDMVKYSKHTNRPLRQDRRYDIRVKDLVRALDFQDVQIHCGDLLLVRTGWLSWFVSLPQDRQRSLSGTIGNGFESPGLEASEGMAEFLWDHGVVGIAADNVACEALPVDSTKGFLHRRLIPLLGIAMGEYWDLELLAEECSATGHYDFLLVAGAMPIPRAAGSPVTAFAVT